MKLLDEETKVQFKDIIDEKLRISELIEYPEYFQGLPLNPRRLDQLFWFIPYLFNELLDDIRFKKYYELLWNYIIRPDITEMDRESLESEHKRGVFMSELVEFYYTNPCKLLLKILVAGCNDWPSHTNQEVNKQILRYLYALQLFGWGHGLEKPSNAQNLIHDFTVIGLFPMSYSEFGDEIASVLHSIAKSALEISTKKRAFNQNPQFAKILYGIDLGDINVDNMDEMISKEQYSTINWKWRWTLNQEIPLGELLSLLNKDRYKISISSVPWHLLKLTGTQEEWNQLLDIGKEMDFKGLYIDTIINNFGVLLKLDGLPKKIK